MKKSIITMVGLLGWISVDAMAACTDPQIIGRTLNTLITSKTVCAISGTDKWQEYHNPNTELWDYKKGPNPPEKADPTSKVGNWSIATNKVTYTYTGGASYTYTIHGPAGGPYSFCTNGTEIVGGATFKSGLVSCGY